MGGGRIEPAVDKDNFEKKSCEVERVGHLLSGVSLLEGNGVKCVFVGLVFFGGSAALGRRELSMITVREQETVVKLK